MRNQFSLDATVNGGQYELEPERMPLLDPNAGAVAVVVVMKSRTTDCLKERPATKERQAPPRSKTDKRRGEAT
jgi:hypothetical protein